MRYSSNDRRCSKRSSVGKTLTMPRATASTSTYAALDVCAIVLTRALLPSTLLSNHVRHVRTVRWIRKDCMLEVSGAHPRAHGDCEQIDNLFSLSTKQVCS